MKLSRLIIIIMAGWAGLMYYRYHAVAKMFTDSYQESDTSSGASRAPSGGGGSFYGGSSGGGIGPVGGLGPVGSGRGGYSSTSAQRHY